MHSGKFLFPKRVPLSLPSTQHLEDIYSSECPFDFAQRQKSSFGDIYDVHVIADDTSLMQKMRSCKGKLDNSWRMAETS